MDTLADRIKKRIKEEEERLAFLNKYLKQVESLGLKEGDFCFHPELGKGIIQKMCPPEQAYRIDQSPEIPIGKAAIATALGTHEVDYKDLMPVTDMGQILYDKRYTDEGS